MKINEVLHEIQTKLKAPKGQLNKFGKYNYRSCEDILEAVKKCLVEYKDTFVTVSDEVKLIGDRYYVVATATISNSSGEIKVRGFARESLDKKGMDSAQITGAASSYSRKYALNGLFCIDDTKDADTQDNRPVNKTRAVKSNGNLGMELMPDIDSKVMAISENIQDRAISLLRRLKVTGGRQEILDMNIDEKKELLLELAKIEQE